MADFASSKKISGVSNYLVDVFDVVHMIPYVDPNLFINENKEQPYIFSTKSDIYSLGVIFWQLSSGFRPFYNEGLPYDMYLGKAIKFGKREEIIKDTPIEYIKLYTGNYLYIINYYFLLTLTSNNGSFIPI